MPDKVQDVRAWLRTASRDPVRDLERNERRQLAEVLSGPLMKPVWARLGERLEGMKDRAMSLELAKPDELAMLQSLQAESRGIIAVLELMWEMTDVDS
jgi:hypothetical protein